MLCVRNSWKTKHQDSHPGRWCRQKHDSISVFHLCVWRWRSGATTTGLRGFPPRPINKSRLFLCLPGFQRSSPQLLPPDYQDSHPYYHSSKGTNLLFCNNIIIPKSAGRIFNMEAQDCTSFSEGCWILLVEDESLAFSQTINHHLWSNWTSDTRVAKSLSAYFKTTTAGKKWPHLPNKQNVEKGFTLWLSNAKSLAGIFTRPCDITPKNVNLWAWT